MNGSPTADWIGVWQRTPDGEEYQRTAGSLTDWARWAERSGFPRATSGRRVLFFGESAARGMHFDPDFTPAWVLHRCLSAMAADEIDVIDLARIGARTEHVLNTAASAVELAPDAVVVFAGNNWKYELLQASTRAQEARSLIEGGVAGVLRQREAALAAVARDFVNRMCEIFAGVAPLLFVMPESNLRIGYPETLSPALGDGREPDWLELTAQLRVAVDAGDWTAALSHAVRLHELDGGLSEEAYQCIGRVCLMHGDVAGAIAAFRRARDVRLWYDGADPAWLPMAGADAAMSAALEAGADILDLTSILPAHAASGVPDDSLFLDWCHLNARGIKVVAAEIARRVAAPLGVVASGADLAATVSALNPTPVVLAAAHLSAAVHNAHWGLPRDVVAGHAAAAVAVCDDAVAVMRELCSLRESSAPLWTQPGWPTTAPNLRRLTTTVMGGREMLDAVVVDVFREYSQGHSRPDPARRDNRALWPDTRTDLLAEAYCPYWLPRGWEGLLDSAGSTLMSEASCHRHYFRAYADRSRFTFVLAEPVPLAVELTGRLGIPGAGTARILVNGTEVHEFGLADRWRTVHLLVGAAAVRAGTNSIDVMWRREDAPGLPAPALAACLERGSTRELAVVFGEIYSLYATAMPSG
jgi:hypothetical protein